MANRIEAPFTDSHSADRLSQLLRDRKADRIITSPKRISFFKVPKRFSDEYIFGLAVRNDGPFTIRDCLFSVSMMGKEEEHDASFFFKWSLKKCGYLHPGETPLEIPVGYETLPEVFKM
jgi:hypothetical protein